jgi:thiol-disulfide isomerase/thioredoxin
MFTKFKQQMIKNLTDKAFWISNLKTLGLMLIIILAVTSYQQRNMLTGSAPELKGQINNDKPTLVYFWGSWCAICKTTSPSVSTLAIESAETEQSAYNIKSVALSSGSDKEVSAYLEKSAYHFQFINDDNGKISKHWGVAVTPSIFVIDTQGDISYVSTGITSLWGMRIRLWLASF